MSWRDSLRTASFRGIEFKVDGHDAAFGRRKVTHEFAQRDEPYTEDLGRSAREFTIEAYLIGDDYPAQRDRLIAACEAAGPGELVHPYLGNMQVEVTGLRVRETSAEGRICRLQLTFVEAGQARFPSDTVDHVREVTAAGNILRDAARGGFLARFLTHGYPSFVLDHAAAKLRAFSNQVSNLPFNPVGEAQAVAAFFSRVRDLATNALQLVSSPGDMADEVQLIIAGMRDVFGLRADRVLRSVRAGHEARYSGPTGTLNRQQQQANEDALSALIRRTALVEQAKAAVIRAENSGAGDVDDTDRYLTREEAIAARDEITDALDAEMEDPTTSMDEFQAMTGLRAAVVRGVPSPELRLPRIAEVTPPATLPSLVISHQLYGTAARAEEIAIRNRSRHPGFIQGGEPLQVVAYE